MDAIKKGMSKATQGDDQQQQGGQQEGLGQQGSGQQEQGLGQQGGDQQEQGGAGQQDYMDKAVGAGVKKSGYDVSPENQKKVADAGRGAYEKASGGKFPS